MAMIRTVLALMWEGFLHCCFAILNFLRRGKENTRSTENDNVGLRICLVMLQHRVVIRLLRRLVGNVVSDSYTLFSSLSWGFGQLAFAM